MNKCYLTIFCNHYRDWSQPFKPCNESYHENQKKKIRLTVFPLFVLLFCAVLYTGYLMHCYIFLLLTLQGFPHLTIFPCLIYMIFPFLLKLQIYRVFPVCITILSCSVYRVSSALLHFLTAHITGFSLFCKQFFPVQFIGFPCYYKNSDLHKIPCSYSHFFLLRLQGIPCLYYTFLMLILIFTPFHHYIIFPVIAT